MAYVAMTAKMLLFGDQLKRVSVYTVMALYSHGPVEACVRAYSYGPV